ncbi:RpiR family transcriptional regulator [Pokkaliibacter plantistimulans]|uniref:RpiR family transcriptional regulator n=1 Tax=Pokkaliibacter plantistimulans TaxID=1635171 RepID=A0ABX5M0L4_9GAMM|nr:MULTISPECIES: MurR/RpiR family transcriptional regulator [Pokkaliibacter]MDH2436124.1 MurR/RpiR family transcriptional regulator [Pokkaliibacter sp. MBI-7]PXF31934.1 RpiR family transcriptional regulator [Pokkaliibacter plantistimulans]
MKQIDQRVKAQYQALTQQEQKVADFILDHLDDFAIYNSVELARVCQVSKATVSRFFKRLGYKDFRDVRLQSRQLRQSGVPLTDMEAIVAGNTLLERHYQRETENLLAWMRKLTPELFEQIVGATLNARRILVLGYRNSYPVALHLRQQLQQVRGGVGLAPQPGQSLSEELAELGKEDLVIAIAFRRRIKLHDKLMPLLKKRGIPLLMISDATAMKLSEHATWWLECPLDSVSAFDSYSAAMSMINVLANALLHQCLEQGRARISQISDIYEELDELSLTSINLE